MTKRIFAFAAFLALGLVVFPGVCLANATTGDESARGAFSAAFGQQELTAEAPNTQQNNSSLEIGLTLIGLIVITASGRQYVNNYKTNNAMMTQAMNDMQTLIKGCVVISTFQNAEALCDDLEALEARKSDISKELECL